MKRINYNDIQILNGRNVRYQGKALDKCAIASLIHDVAFDAGNCSWPLWSDIYWDSATKSELCNFLKEFLYKLI